MPAPSIEYRQRGDSWVIPFTVTNRATGLAFTGLSTSTIVATIKTKDTDILFWTGTKAGGQIVVTDNAAGQGEVRVPYSATAAAGLIYYICDIQVTTSDDYRWTPVVIYIAVERDAS